MVRERSAVYATADAGGAVVDYSAAYRSSTWVATAATALGLASAPSGSFLGANSNLAATLLGRWNDDIMWYTIIDIGTL